MTSRLLLMTGTECHRMPRSENQASSGCSSGTSCTAWPGSWNMRGPSSTVSTTSGSTSKAPRGSGGRHPRWISSLVKVR